jgi:RecJ-like exonuclease
MGDAMDCATKDLRDTGQPAIVQEIIAKRIVDIAASGERDPQKLASMALHSLGIAGCENMDEKLPIPCEHCHGTGIQAGLECKECGGRGHRVVVAGKLQPNGQNRQPRQQPQRWRQRLPRT